MAGSLREALEGAIEQHEATAPVEPVAPIDKVDAATIAQSETVGEKNNAAAAQEDKNAAAPSKTDGRARDEQGRFAEGSAKPPEKTAQVVVAPAQAPIQTTAPQGPAPVVPPADAAKYPTTWKKGLETQWSTLAPEVKAEIMRREGNYASGVSTYKQEWDRAKPLIDVLAPYNQIFQQHNVRADQHVAMLLKTHHDLVMSPPAQKAGILMNIMRSNGVTPEMLFVQGQDGKVYFNPNIAQAAPQQQAPQPSIGPEDVKKMVADQMSVAKNNQEIETFLSQTDKYPHAKEVAPQMAQLLEANLADDLPSAYQAALRLPANAALYEADQKQVRETAEKAAAEAKAKQTAAARRNAVSVRSSAPTSVSNAPNGKKSLRDQIAENVDGVAGGRV